MNKTKLCQKIIGAILFILGICLVVTGAVTYVRGESKINEQDPAFKMVLYGIFAFSIGAVIFCNGLSKIEPVKLTMSQKTTRLVQAALFAALAYIGFQFFKIDIAVGAEKTAFHLGNTFVVLGALLLGGSWGGIAGAIGLTIADLTSGYVTSAPKTFLLKLLIGLLAGFVAHHIFHLTKTGTSKKKVFLATIVSSAVGLGFNIIADPLVGYFYKLYLFGIPQDMAKTLAKISTITTSVNAVLSVIAATILYTALRPILIKTGLFIRLEKNEDK